MSDSDRDQELDVPQWWATAFVLDELSPAQRERMSAALRTDRSLLAIVKESQDSVHLVRRALQYEGRQSVSGGRRAPRLGWRWVAIAAFAIALAVVLVIVTPGEGTVAVPSSGQETSISKAQASPAGPTVSAHTETDGELWASGESETSVRIVVEGTSNRSDLRTIPKYTSKYLRSIEWCYQRRQRSHPAPAGTLMFVFAVDPDGRTHDASIDPAGLRDDALERCVADKIARWRFPAPRGGTPRVVVTMTFPMAQ